tara:strand:- start:87 stop:281 length:195 start_codon:yes stop_codon:yes gene_type:complete
VLRDAVDVFFCKGGAFCFAAVGAGEAIDVGDGCVMCFFKFFVELMVIDAAKGFYFFGVVHVLCG